MFKLSRYKFSRESQKELQDFIVVVQQSEIQAPVHVKNEELWANLVPMQEESKPVLPVTSDVEMLEIAPASATSFTKPVLPVEDLSEVIQEYLETDSVLLRSLIDDLTSAYLEPKVKDVFITLANSLSATQTHKFGTILLADDAHGKLHRSFCKELLIRKMHLMQDEILVSLLNEFLKAAPNEIVDVIVDEIVSNDTANYLDLHLKLLATDYKKQILTGFCNVCPELDIFHLATLEAILISNLDSVTVQKLGKLLSSTSNNVVKQKSFGKFLMAFFQSSSSNLGLIRHDVDQILRRHKSGWSRQLEKLVKEIRPLAEASDSLTM